MFLHEFVLNKPSYKIYELMSGDNLLGDQPLKFYSEEVTQTKIELVHRLLILNAQKNSIVDLDKKHKEWADDLAS